MYPENTYLCERSTYVLFGLKDYRWLSFARKHLLMADVVLALQYVQLTIFSVIFILASFYSVATLAVIRLCHRNQLLTINLSLAAVGCSAYWIFMFTTLTFYPRYLLNPHMCPTTQYFEMVCTLQVPLAMIAMSAHRCCSIVYHTKAFFKTKRWVVLCIATQWTVGFLVALPRTQFIRPVRSSSEA